MNERTAPSLLIVHHTSQPTTHYHPIHTKRQCLSMASLLVAQKVVLDVYHPTVVTAW